MNEGAFLQIIVLLERENCIMIKEILTHELLSEQLTVCLAAILNIFIFKMAQMVVLYMDFIFKAVLKRSSSIFCHIFHLKVKLY